ncbi:J domain-containing protein [Planctomycetota bacterium]
MKHDSEFMKHISEDLEARKAARKILGIGELTGPCELKKAYRQAAKKYHPDRHENSEESNKKFTLINCAYELLAFDKPCPEILEGINAWPGVPEDDQYCLESSWGHFLWWCEKFYGDRSNTKKSKRPVNSCI